MSLPFVETACALPGGSLQGIGGQVKVVLIHREEKINFVVVWGQIHQIKGKYERALLSLESAISDLLFGRNRVFLQNI